MCRSFFLFVWTMERIGCYHPGALSSIDNKLENICNYTKVHFVSLHGLPTLRRREINTILNVSSMIKLLIVGIPHEIAMILVSFVMSHK